MPKIGRNAPCPCGSGKKYKRCCLPFKESSPWQPSPEPNVIGVSPDGWKAVYEDIDLLSNSVVDLIKAGKLDEAEAACKRLSKEFPDQVDGLERMGMVEEARGNYRSAAQYYRKAAAFMGAYPGFDKDAVSWMLGQAEVMETKAGNQ